MPDTILIADDDPVTRDMLTAMLSAEHYGLIFAAGGLETLAKVGALMPDVILLDVLMPDMDGFEVCRKLKAEGRFQTIPVIMISVLKGKEDMIRGFDAGADDFLSKPVNGTELRARIRSMLRIKKRYDELRSTLNFRESLEDRIIRDLREVLYPLLGYGDLLIKKAEGPDDLKHIRNLSHAASRLDRSLADLLTATRIQGDGAVTGHSETDMNLLIAESLKCHEDAIREKHLTTVSDLPKKSRKFFLDANLFQNVLDHLILNAVRASPEGGMIVLQAAYPDKPSAPKVSIRISDEGNYPSGFFDKFISSGSKKDIPDSESGLAFCKTAVRAMGGRISAEPGNPGGAVFTVEIFD
jgi:CheY-like chemotaxis protein